MAIRKGSSYKDRPKWEKTVGTRAFEHALDIELMIIDRMEELGLKKSELAKRAGMSKSGLSNFLNGQPNMTLETMTRFEVALDAVFEISLKPVAEFKYSLDSAEQTLEGFIDAGEELVEAQSTSAGYFSLVLAQPNGECGAEAARIVDKTALLNKKEQRVA